MKAIGLHGSVSSDPHLLQIEETDCAKNSGQDLIARKMNLQPYQVYAEIRALVRRDQDSHTWDKNI